LYEPHVWVRRPTDENVPIWRYLKTNRFIDLIDRRQLHFARFDQYPDPWEGVLPTETRALSNDHFRNVPIRPGDTLTDFEMYVRDVNRINKLCSYANCWFMNEHDSDAMWRLYAPEGVAVRSTLRRLCGSVAQEPEPVYVGEVVYFDFRTEQPPTYGVTLPVAFSKRRQYEHERELRAVIVKPPAEWTSGSAPYEEYRDVHPKFMKVPVELDILIERICLAPGSPEAFQVHVREAMRRHGLDKPIELSALDDRPDLV
jgi:hypothetical protein